MGFSKNSSYLNLFEVYSHALIPSVVSRGYLSFLKKRSQNHHPQSQHFKCWDFLRTVQQTGRTIISSVSITWSLSERSQLPPDLVDTTNSFQLLPKRCGEVQAQLIPSAIPTEESGCSCLRCNAALLWGYEQPRLNSLFLSAMEGCDPGNPAMGTDWSHVLLSLIVITDWRIIPSWAAALQLLCSNQSNLRARTRPRGIIPLPLP